MPKGKRCPCCGQMTFHESGAVHECPSCGGIGWWGLPGSNGSGKGAWCHSCGSHTLHTIYINETLKVLHCSSLACRATVVRQA